MRNESRQLQAQAWKISGLKGSVQLHSVWQLLPVTIELSRQLRAGQLATDHIRILSIGLELACNGGKCGGILSNANTF